MGKGAIMALATLIGLGLSTLALGAEVARGQSYPPPVGSLSLTSSATISTAGSEVTLSARVLDNAGSPVAGAEVLFRIVSQPGSDASLGGLQVTKTTDANGVATAVLHTGSTPGTIIVETVSGEKTSRLTVGVQTTAVPATGSAPAETGGEGNGWLVALLAGGASVLAGGGLLAASRRRRKA